MYLYKGLCQKISTNIMTAEEFIFKSSPYRKITGEDFKELYNELTTDKLSVSGFNPVSNVESTYHLLSYNIGMGKGRKRLRVYTIVDFSFIRTFAPSF